MVTEKEVTEKESSNPTKENSNDNQTSNLLETPKYTNTMENKPELFPLYFSPSARNPSYKWLQEKPTQLGRTGITSSALLPGDSRTGI